MTDQSISGNSISSEIGVSTSEETFYARWGKRVFDVVFILLAMPILVPIIGMLWVIVRFDGGPGFFSQYRVGKDGQVFRCWKLRSMVPNSQEMLQQLLESDAALRAEWEQDQKLKDDPRITKFGQVLRRTSLDELPQFWNVLKGDMSLVGPRPVLPKELDRYEVNAVWYMRVRPGITGAWQVSGRNEVTYAERVAIDVEYAKAAAFVTDLVIIARTVLEVVRRSGR